MALEVLRPRRVRPATLGMAALLLSLVLAACAGGAARHGVGKYQGKPIPWAALPVKPVPAATPLAVPVGTAECSASQLEVHFLGSAGLTGGQIVSNFEFADRSSALCQLDGTPTVRLRSASGSEISVKPEPYPLGTEASQPVLMVPGLTGIGAGAAEPGQAVLGLGWPDIDEAAGGTECSPAPAVVGTVTLVLPAGAGQISVAVPTTGVRPGPLAPCGGLVGASPWQAVIPTPPLPRVSARIVAPTHAAAGTVLRYRVVLTNRSRVVIDLRSSCASYLETLSGGTAAALKVVHRYQLNCAAAGVLRPQASAAFAMALAIPQAAPRVKAYLGWSLQGGTGFALPGAGLSVARIEIT